MKKHTAYLFGGIVFVVVATVILATTRPSAWWSIVSTVLLYIAGAVSLTRAGVEWLRSREVIEAARDRTE